MSDPIARLNAALEGRYRIERELGEGGMATVYLATDVRHERKVALKVLRPELAAVVGAERFLAEIKTTANLQHPHILPLFDSGEANGFLFYVMPYVQGESLRERLEREKQLPVDEAVRIGTAVAQALDYAHRQGVVHRDIKPANLLIHDGQPLIADFGIALAVQQAGGGRLTETGLSLGTPHYMSPEQATLDRIPDARSDVYSLSCVVYEMLTGDPPFQGGTAQAVLARLLTATPDPVRDRRPTVPAHVASAVHRGMAKLPADRWRDCTEFARALTTPGLAEVHAARGSARPDARLWQVATGVLSVALLAVLGKELLGTSASPGQTLETHFVIPVPEGHTMKWGEAPMIAISPDGRTVAYATDAGLYLRPLDGFEVNLVPGTENGWNPVFSADNQWVYVHTSWGQLTKVGLDGRAPVPVDGMEANTGGMSWAPDGRIAFLGRDGSIWSTPDESLSGAPIAESLDSVSSAFQRWPQFLSDDLLVYTAMGVSRGPDDGSTVLRELSTGETWTLAQGGTMGRYLPTGHVVYVRSNGTVVGSPYDLDRRTPVGPEVALLTDVRVSSVGGSASFAVSETGTVVFVQGSASVQNVARWVATDGQLLATVGSPNTIFEPAVSPTGSRVAWTRRLPDNNDVLIVNPDGSQQRITFEPNEDETSAWSPDGTRLAYSSSWIGLGQRIFIKSLAPDLPAEVLYETPRHPHVSDWSPDGRWLAIQENDDAFTADIWLVDVNDPDVRRPLAATEDLEWQARFHPTGDYVAYAVGEDGAADEVRVATIDGTPRGQASTSGGSFPRWSGDGRELFYCEITSDPKRVMVVAFDPERGTLGPPEPLFDAPCEEFDVDKETGRFLIIFPNPDAAVYEIRVIQNWFEAVKRLAPPAGNR